MNHHLANRYIVFFFMGVFIFASLRIKAQHNPLLHGDTASGLYVVYKIQKKDNLFSIGKKYGVRYQQIIDFNKMSDVSISVGQEIKIPVTRDNFVNQDIETNDNFLPLVHVVKAKEGLFRIGVSYYKTPIQLLMKWNGLRNYNLKIDQRLIVGYIRPLGVELTYIGSPDKFKGQPYVPPLRSLSEEREASKIAKKQQMAESQTAPLSPNKTEAKGGVGFFEKEFKETWSDGVKGQKTASLKTAVFNSNSGWNDGKYYAMSSVISPQTIVAVTNKEENKVIYAKVLGGLPVNFKDKGCDLIISSAAGAALNITQTGQIKVTYCVY